MNILKVKNISHKYGKCEALNNISFEVTNGLIGVLGPNGAGKTTLMKILTTLFPIQNGEVTLNNLNYKNNLAEIRSNIGYLPQNFETYNTLTGREFLEIIASLKLEWDKDNIQKHIDEIVIKLNMNNYIDERIKKYSGGMKQKLGFAQVLIGKPNLIIVDEPTVGLDPEQRNTIRELFPVISKDKIVFVTTHIVEDIEFYCDYLIVIKKGKLIYFGTKNDFIRKTDNLIWETFGDNDIFEKLSSKAKILSTTMIDGGLKFKYISKNPLTEDSINIKSNLQDAYIAYGTLINEEL